MVKHSISDGRCIITNINLTQKLAEIVSIVVAFCVCDGLLKRIVVLLVQPTSLICISIKLTRFAMNPKCTLSHIKVDILQYKAINEHSLGL